MFLAHQDPVELSLGTRVELAIGGQWRAGRVGQMGEEPGRLEVNLREEFRGELGYWVHVSSLRLADPEPAAPAPELPRQPCKDCGGCGMIHYRARGGSITGSGPCPCRSAFPATEPQ